MEYHRVKGADYLAILLHPETRKIVVRKMVAAGRRLDKVAPFEAVVFTGNSGSLVGPEVATKLKKKMVVVGKAGVNRHYPHLTEGAAEVGPYIFFDDLIASGETLFRVMTQMAADRPGSKLVGVLLYLKEATGIRCFRRFEAHSPLCELDRVEVVQEGWDWKATGRSCPPWERLRKKVFWYDWDQSSPF